MDSSYDKEQYAPHLQLIAKDPVQAWKEIPQHRQRKSDGLSDLNKAKQEGIFQIRSIDHVLQRRTTVERSIKHSYKRYRTANRNRLADQLDKLLAHRRQGAIGQRRSTHIPTEVATEIVAYYVQSLRSLEVDVWVSQGKTIHPNTTGKYWDEAGSDLDIFEEDVRCFVAMIPLFHASKWLRQILICELTRQWRGKPRVLFLTTIKLFGDGAKDSRPFEISMAYPNSSDMLYTMHPAIALRSTHLRFETVFNGGLFFTNLGDLFGFASEFHNFRRISLCCRVSNITEETSAQELARDLFSPHGVYDTLVDSAAEIIATVAWNYGTNCSGLPRGYCLLPNCNTRRQLLAEPCPHRIPPLACRTLNILVPMLPRID